MDRGHGFAHGDDIQIRLFRPISADAPMWREPTKSLLAGETGHRFAPCAKCGGVRLHEAGGPPIE